MFLQCISSSLPLNIYSDCNSGLVSVKMTDISTTWTGIITRVNCGDQYFASTSYWSYRQIVLVSDVFRDFCPLMWLIFQQINRGGKFQKKLWCCIGGRVQQGTIYLVFINWGDKEFQSWSFEYQPFVREKGYHSKSWLWNWQSWHLELANG